MIKKFEGVMPAIITPFEKDCVTVNEKVARELIEFQLGQGADGFYVLGGTGEGLLMNREQRERMCEIAVNQVAKRKPVICHIAAMDFEEAIALAKHAEKTGADAIAAVPPIFYGYDENDIYEYYKNIAQSVSIPVIIYYHPGAQKVMSVDLIAKIFEVDNVTGVKWSSFDYYDMLRVKDATNGDMNIINGPDQLLVCGLASGADAGIGSTYNIILPQFKEIYDYVKAGEIEKANALQLKVNRVVEGMRRTSLIPSIKYAVTLMGFDVGEAARPMKRLDEGRKEAIRKLLKEEGFSFNA